MHNNSTVPWSAPWDGPQYCRTEVPPVPPPAVSKRDSAGEGTGGTFSGKILWPSADPIADILLHKPLGSQVFSQHVRAKNCNLWRQLPLCDTFREKCRMNAATPSRNSTYRATPSCDARRIDPKRLASSNSFRINASAAHGRRGASRLSRQVSQFRRTGVAALPPQLCSKRGRFAAQREDQEQPRRPGNLEFRHAVIIQRPQQGSLLFYSAEPRSRSSLTDLAVCGYRWDNGQSVITASRGTRDIAAGANSKAARRLLPVDLHGLCAAAPGIFGLGVALLVDLRSFGPD